MMSTHDKSVDGSSTISKQMNMFTSYPEALHVADSLQCKRFNGELMKRMVSDKRKNNHKFQDGKCMNEAFKYFARIDHTPN